MKFFVITLSIANNSFRVTVNDVDNVVKDEKIINYFLTQTTDTICNDYVIVVDSLNAIAKQLSVSASNIEHINFVCTMALQKYTVNFKDYANYFVTHFG